MSDKDATALQDLVGDGTGSEVTGDAGEDTRRDRLYARAMDRGAECTRCALYRTKTPRGPVPGEIHRSNLVIIGEAPGGKEVHGGHVFIGPSGRELDESLRLGGLRRSDVSIINTIECQPDLEGGSLADYLQALSRRPVQLADGSTALDPITACRGRLLSDIKAAKADIALAVGGRALEALANIHGFKYGKGKDTKSEVCVSTILNQHGAPIPVPEAQQDIAGLKVICSSLHPAFAMRGAKPYKPVIRNDIARAAHITMQGGKIDWSGPKHKYVFPTLRQVEEVCAWFTGANARVTVDIETDSVDTMRCKVRCVGLGAVLNGEEHVLVVPIRWMNGQDYWKSPSDLKRVEHAVRQVLDNCPLIFHNGPYDTSVLLRVGLMTDRKKLWDDTLIADHDTDANDLPHALGAVARRYFPVPMWKKDVDHKASGAVGEDNDLHEYNVTDVLVTMRLWPELDKRMVQCGTIPQYETDKQTAPICREMQTLGVFVNEHVRGVLSERLNKICSDMTDKFHELSGTKLNLRSPRQLGQWLFGDLELLPPLNPQGYEWKEGDDWSTSAAAVTKILEDRALPDNVHDALSTLLEYKAYEKLRSTYTDGLKVYHDVMGVDHLPARGALGPRPLITRMHPTWKNYIVPTGRWASSPNLQNIPARSRIGNMRRMFCAPPGHVLVGADFEQVELRIYALMADDQLLLRAFAEGMDPHTLNAATVKSKEGTEAAIMELYEKYMHMKKHGTEEEKGVVKYLRTVAKKVAFGFAYGAEAEKMFQIMSTERDKLNGRLVFPGITLKDCNEWYERWHRMHPETHRWHETCHRMQRQLGYVAAIGDWRKRFFPGGVDKKNSVPNHTIQGAAGWLMNRGIIRLAEAIPHFSHSDYTGICLQVHDYAGVYVPARFAWEAQGIVRECLEAEWDGMKFTVDAPLATWDLAQQG